MERLSLSPYNSLVRTFGVATGVKTGQFSFSYNWRSAKLPLKDILECIQDPNSAAPLGSFVRSLYEKGASYSNTLQALTSVRMCVPAYLIIGGPNKDEGMVLTRDTNASLYPQPLCFAAGAWYAAQSNADWWKPCPVPHDDRRSLAIATLKHLGQQQSATEEGLLYVMSTPKTNTTKGVLNEDTLYTAIMAPFLPFSQSGMLFVRIPTNITR